MVTAAHRTLLGAAGTELAAASAAIDGSVGMTRRLPWIIGRRESLHTMDMSLEAAAAHAREAIRHLDGVQLEPGTGADAITQAREAVRSYLGLIEQRQALPKAAGRWFDTTVERTAGRRPERTAEGLRAIGEDRTFAWATAPFDPYVREHDASVAARRMLAPLEPEVADRIAPYLPDEPLRWDPVTRQHVDSFVADPGTARSDLPGQVVWAIAQRAFNGSTTRVSASDLRRIVDDAMAHARRELQRPPWVDAVVDDAPIVIDPARAADLALLRHSGSPKHVDLFVAQALMSEMRSRYRGADFGAEIAAAARRLPDGYGSRVPEGVEFDSAAAEQWSRVVRTRQGNAIASGRAPSAALVDELLDATSGAESGVAVGRALVARDVIDRLDAGGDPVRTAMIANVRRRVDAFIASSERSWHVDYGELGRAQSASALLVRVEASAANRPVASVSQVPGDLAW